MRVLLVKTSSLGDVIHNLPVASDIVSRYPGAVIDWVVEENFADIPRLHPAVRKVIPVAVRRWRKQLFARGTWDGVQSLRRSIRQEVYDCVIDTQGLLKSALIARQAHGPHYGYGMRSAREPMAVCFYDTRFEVAKQLHAVERNRRLASHVLGYPVAGSPDYGLQRIPHQKPFADSGDFAVLLTATSRADKLWPEDHWIALGRQLAEQGLNNVLPAGSKAEREAAERIARSIPGARVLPPSNLRQLATILAAARLAVGVDTGLIHLAAALGTPCIALFCASDPELTGVYAGKQAVNLGDRGSPPELAVVLRTVRQLC